MGDSSQIRLIEPVERTMRHTPALNCRVIPDDDIVNRAFDAYKSGKGSLREIAARIGCTERVLTTRFIEEFGPGWKLERGTWL